MKYLGISAAELSAKGAINTAKEISQQPEVWLSILNSIDKKRKEIKSFTDTAYRNINKIVLTGAGTSAFIGLSLKGIFFRNSGIETQAIATTHNLTCTHFDFFGGRHKCLDRILTADEFRKALCPFRKQS